MVCENCGKQIDCIVTNVFLRDGSDGDFEFPLIENKLLHLDECEEDAVYFETDSNWTGYDLSEDEMNEIIRCPKCGRNPFKDKEIQVYDVVRVVKFKTCEEG